MKKLNKLLALALAVILTLSLCTGVFADDPTPVDGHEYQAFQIFTGTQNDDSTDASLGDIEWGNGVNKNTFLAALVADAEGKFDGIFEDCETAKEVAEAIAEAEWADKSAPANAFAELAYANKATGADVVAGDTLDAGYYLIVDITTSESGDENFVNNLALLQLTKKGTLDIECKVDVPEVVKNIVDDGDKVKANTAEIGDTITYEFTGTMPSDIANYDTYYYVFHDTLSNGLTFDPSTVKVTVNGIDATKYFYADATGGDGDDTEITIGIEDILELQNVMTEPEDDETAPTAVYGAITAGTTVVVTYDAVLNENAVVGTSGTTNDVYLQYSNNPNDDGEGSNTPPSDNPNEPEPVYPTGNTPKDTVVTFTTKIELTKVDGTDSTKTLTGAKFSISGKSSKVNIINSEMYVKVASGENPTGDVYYRLKNGTYTTTEPVAEDDPATTDKNEKNIEAYDSTDKYQKVTKVTTKNVDEDFTAEGWVGANGVITFTGLGEGTYTITELVAPSGYNLLTEDITIVVASNAADLENITADSKITWTASNGGAGDAAKSYTVDNAGTVKLDVENNKGSTLPETGGIGTTIFYVIGGILLVGAAVLLITKKRMGVEA